MANVVDRRRKVAGSEGKGDALAAFLSEQAAVVLGAEPGCLVYRAHRSTTDPELFLFYETYVDDKAFESASQRAAPFRIPPAPGRGRAWSTERSRVEIYRSITRSDRLDQLVALPRATVSPLRLPAAAALREIEDERLSDEILAEAAVPLLAHEAESGSLIEVACGVESRRFVHSIILR